MISQKATILCILDILQKYSDGDHKLSTDKIREKLKSIYDIEMERRTIYRNIDALRSMGIDIEGYSDNREGYCLLDRTFEVSEIRLLCDAIAASDMIQPDTSKKMIHKLSETLSVFQSRLLQKTVYVKKPENDSLTSNSQIFYNIDTLNIAINQGCKVCATELYYDSQLHFVPRKGTPVIFSPYATIWANHRYYVIGKNQTEDDLTHYRIDCLQDIQILEHSVDMIFGGINPHQYAEKYIYQKGESMISFDIECEPSILPSIAEHFGKNTTILKKEHYRSVVRIRCIPSLMKDWVLAHCNSCEVLSPQNFRDEIRVAIMDGYKKYWN